MAHFIVTRIGGGDGTLALLAFLLLQANVMYDMRQQRFVVEVVLDSSHHSDAFPLFSHCRRAKITRHFLITQR